MHTWVLTIPKGTPQDQLLLKQARENLLSGNYHVSERILHELQTKHPTEPSLYAMLGITQYLRGHIQHSGFSFSTAHLLAQKTNDKKNCLKNSKTYTDGKHLAFTVGLSPEASSNCEALRPPFS